MQTKTHPAAAMLTALAARQSDLVMGGAMLTARDLIDMGLVADSTLDRMVLGMTPITDVLAKADAALVASLADLANDPDAIDDIETVLDDCRDAAEILAQLTN